MKKKIVKPLRLSRETLLRMEVLGDVVGGDPGDMVKLYDNNNSAPPCVLFTVNTICP
jgi:hypothetical protein